MRIQLTDQGSVWIFHPLDKEAEELIHNIGAEPWQFFGNALVVDHRPAQQLVEQLADDGVEFVT